MEIKLSKLFDVEIIHNYSSSGLNEDFNIVPTSLSKLLFKNYRLLFRSLPKGFIVLYETGSEDADGEHPLKLIENDIKFSFALIPKNPFLLNYTDLPVYNSQIR